MPSNAVTTVPSISVSTNQSSIVGHILPSLTNKPSSPVTAAVTPIMPFAGKYVIAATELYYLSISYDIITIGVNISNY